MTFTVLCYSLLAFYGVIWFFDSFFKSCMHYPYFAFLDGTGLKIGIFHFTWTTTAFNRLIYRWTRNLSSVLRKWYTCGYICTISLILPFSIYVLLTLLVEQFFKSEAAISFAEVKAVLPGVNIPTSDFWIYFLAMALSTIVHELGHAMAAAQEDVQIISVGLYVCIILPVAFVQLNTEQLNSLTVTKRMKIYCAGIWHNFATAFIAILLYLSAPVLFNIAYETGKGVRVVELTYDSPLNDERGLSVGDIVTSINKCTISNAESWYFCLRMAHNRYGICTSATFIETHDEVMAETIKENNIVECCHKGDINSFCFEYIEPEIGANSVLPGQYSCLKPRDMIQKKLHKCEADYKYVCPSGLYCLKPMLKEHTYLIVIKRHNAHKTKEDNEKLIIYLGLPYDLWSTVTVDEYFPKLSLFSFFSPLQFERLLQFISMFSMGIAFINVLPCYGMDGHHIIRNLFPVLTKYNRFLTILTLNVFTCLTGFIITCLFYKTIFNAKSF